MTYNQVLEMLLTFFRQHNVGFVAAADPELQHQKALTYTPGVDCNIRGWDVFKHTKLMNQNNVILRYKASRTLRARVFFVLPGAKQQFRDTHDGAVRDPF